MVPSSKGAIESSSSSDEDDLELTAMMSRIRQRRVEKTILPTPRTRKPNFHTSAACLTISGVPLKTPKVTVRAARSVGAVKFETPVINLTEEDHLDSKPSYVTTVIDLTEEDQLESNPSYKSDVKPSLSFMRFRSPPRLSVESSSSGEDENSESESDYSDNEDEKTEQVPGSGKSFRRTRRVIELSSDEKEEMILKTAWDDNTESKKKAEKFVHAIFSSKIDPQNRDVKPGFKNEKPSSSSRFGEKIIGKLDSIDSIKTKGCKKTSGAKSEWKEDNVKDTAIVLKYKPQVSEAKFDDGTCCKLQPHPAPAVISSAFLGTPATNYGQVVLTRYLKPAFTHGHLSDLQHEGVCRTVQAWWGKGSMCLKYRRGFLLGDQTGMGKGRQLAAAVINNWTQRGVRRAIWFSTSPDLYNDAKRDLDAIMPKGLEIPLFNIKHINKRGSVKVGDGVIYATYSYLAINYVSKCRGLVEWMSQTTNPVDKNASSGTVVFDECHKLKNMLSNSNSLLPKNKNKKTSEHDIAWQEKMFGDEEYIKKIVHGNGTATGKAAYFLQHCIPNACVLYASATSFSSVRNIAPMIRLGLWGPKTAFEDFIQFHNTIKPEKKGRGFGRKNHPGEMPMMEIVGRDLYARGLYIGRMLSYEGVQFSVENVPIPRQFEAVYNRAVGLMWNILEAYDEVSDTLATTSKKALGSKALFWSMNQRLFKTITCIAKLQHAIELTKALTQEGYAVVISLWSTGEARSKGRFSEEDYIGGSDKIHIAHEIARHHIVSVFNPSNFQGEVEQKQVLSIRNKLLKQLQDAKLQDLYNPLDYLKTNLGGRKNGEMHVAELTGRSKHWVKKYVWDGKAKTQRVVERYERRKTIGGDSANVTEAREFQLGKRHIAIISAAASTGISLHSDMKNPMEGQRPRVNLIIELPWAADAALQQMGRVHRTNQAHKPKYVILMSDIGGEQRFVSAVTNRLQSLGALTRGDRTATFAGGDQRNGQSIFEEMNWENSYGVKSLHILGQSLGFSCRVKSHWSQRRNLDLADMTNQKVNEQVQEAMGGGKATDLVLPCVMENKLTPQDLKLPDQFLATLDPHVAQRLLIEVGDGGDGSLNLNQRAKSILYTLIQKGLGGEELFNQFSKFANRIFNLPFRWQKRLFESFQQLYVDTIEEAKANEEFVPGVQDMKSLGAKWTRLKSRKEIYTDNLTKAKTELISVQADYGMSFQEAERLLEDRRSFITHIKAQRTKIPTTTTNSTTTSANSGDRWRPFVVVESEENHENYVGDYGCHDGFYSWVPRASGIHGHKIILRREAFLLLEKLPMKGRMKKSNAAKLRSRIKSNIKFKVYFPHKPSGINVRPIGRRTVRLLDLLEIFQQKQVTKLTTGYKTQMHEKNDATVQHIWDRQYKQAGSQINPKRAKCAQCYECRQKNPKPGLCGGSIHLKRRIITHNLVLGNIMQIWDNISASLDNRTDGNVPKVLRCRVRGKPERGLEGGVFVGLDIESSRLDAFEHKMSTYDHVPQGPMIVARSAASLKKKLGDANLAPTLNESLRSSNKMVNKFKAMSALDIKRYLQRLQLGILFERFKDYKVNGEFLLHINHFYFQAMRVNKFASGRILFNIADSLLRASPSCRSWQAREYDGRVFYYNPSTGISTWDKPSGLQNELSQAGVSFEHVMGRRALARASGSANLRKRKQVLKTNTTHVPLASRNPNSILQPAKKKAKVEVATRVKAEVVKVG